MTTTNEQGLLPADAGVRGVATPATSGHRLRRRLGTGSIVFMVVAAAAPMSVIAASAPITITVGGPSVALWYLVASFILVLFSVGFTLMSRQVKNAGAFYTYVQAGLGRIPGVGAAILALCSYLVLLAAVDVYLGVAISNVVATYSGVDIPWWLLAVATLAIIAFLGYRDIELSSKVLGVLLILEALVIIVLDVAIALRGGKAGIDLAPFVPSASSGSPTLGVMFAFFGFFGFEATAVFRNEAKDPDRTIPRATYIAVIGIGVFYAISSWLVVLGVGTGDVVSAATNDPEGLVLRLAGQYVFPAMYNIMQILLVTSMFACVLSFHNVISRYQFTLGGSGILPRSLGRVNPRHLSPSMSSLVVSALSGIFIVTIAVSGLDAVAEAYTWLSGASTLGIIALMALTSLAVIVFFARTRAETRVWNTVIAPGIALLSMSALLVYVVKSYPVLVGSVGAAWVIATLVVASFVAGMVIALVLRRRNGDVYRALLDDPVA